MLMKAHEAETHIHLDFVPMVDVLFNLLIFFLLATTIKQAEREIQIALPIASAAAPISISLREIVINVNEKGEIIVVGGVVEPDELRRQIMEAVGINPDQKITVRGDRNASYASIVRVLDICKASGIQEPYLDTVLSN